MRVCSVFASSDAYPSKEEKREYSQCWERLSLVRKMQTRCKNVYVPNPIVSEDVTYSRSSKEGIAPIEEGSKIIIG
jgi:hypothetical protein